MALTAMPVRSAVSRGLSVIAPKSRCAQATTAFGSTLSFLEQRPTRSSALFYSATRKFDDKLDFSRGDHIQVEIVRFGRLGASVEVIARSHREEDLINEDEPAIAEGLILQKEIHYFREKRNGLDVIVGEILPAFVENVREVPVMRRGEEMSGEIRTKLDICLRPPGGVAKAMGLAEEIMEKLQESPDGFINVGDKSSPGDINKMFPGASKGAFKKAVSLLFKNGKVIPSPDRVSLASKSK
uniref:Conserved virulence factor B-like winged helix domain-containing protein n=1 Tax=Leptocylindrus danicus TaxID=163516 RepID=A0A7S2PPT2_9STRA